MIFYEDKKYSFWELFNENNGTLIRSNINGTKEDPLMRSFPELIDVGIMGHCDSGKKGICRNAGIDCYQKGSVSRKKNISFEDYKRIVDEAKGKTFQIALGGAGDPNKHEKIAEILQYTRKNNIIPNMTTSGIDITDYEIDLISQNCGAVAVSYYSKIIGGKESNIQTIVAINRLSKAITTNIHYVISKDSIEEAIFRLENEIWPDGINAIVFLLYKPVGFGTVEKVIKHNDIVKKFLDIALIRSHPYRIGFDTCFPPILIDHEECLEKQSIDSCEAARFSMYIDSEMNAYPCSFNNQDGSYKISLRDISIQDAWDSLLFEKFRNSNSDCQECDKFHLCNGGCGLQLGINAGSRCLYQ